jgi:hypothetical protein
LLGDAGTGDPELDAAFDTLGQVGGEGAMAASARPRKKLVDSRQMECHRLRFCGVKMDTARVPHGSGP